MSTEATLGTAVVPIPQGVRAELHGRELRLTGPLGKLSRPFPIEAIKCTTEGAALRLDLLLPPHRKRSRALLHTWERHVGNLVQGVTVGFEARLKSVAAHFPMKLSVRDGKLLIENFLGEKYPRSAAIASGVEATIEGDFVVVRGTDIERVGLCAATIERATRIREYDARVFQDGIYLVEHAHPREG